MDTVIAASTITGDQGHRPWKSRGFSLVEVLIGMLVMTIGLVSLLALFAHAVMSMTYSKESMIAKQKAREALESVYTARNTQQIVWNQISNVIDGGDGIFLNDFQPLYGPGTDSSAGPTGLIGTANHGAVQTMINSAGADDIPGTADDATQPLDNFQRRITISGIGSSNDMRQITVTVRCFVRSGITRDYTVTSIISRFR